MINNNKNNININKNTVNMKV